MRRVFRQVQLPGLIEIQYPEIHPAILICAVRLCQKVPLQAWPPAVTWLGQLQLQQQPVPVANRTISNTAEEPQQKILFI